MNHLPLTLIVLAHPDGRRPFRTTSAGYAVTAAALTSLGVTYDVELREFDSGRDTCPVVDNLSFAGDQVPWWTLALVLRARVRHVHLYDAIENPMAAGPGWRFRSVISSARDSEGPVLLSLDYGPDEGVWLLGGPAPLAAALTKARQLQIPVLGMSRDDQDRPAAFAVSCGDQAVLHQEAQRRGFDVWAQTFGPGDAA